MKKLISLFLSACLFLMVFNFDVLAYEDGDQTEETTIEEETTEESELLVEESEAVIEESELETEPVSVWDGVTTSDVFENDSIRATFLLDNYWNGGYVASVTVENISDCPIENWAFVFEYAGNINSIWNAAIDETVENGYVLKNVGWNQDIQPGSSISFGLSGIEDFQGFPTDYKLLGKVSEVNGEGYSSAYTLYSDWGSGFSGEFAITNTSDSVIEDWIVEFDFDRNITDIWKAEILSHEDNHYVIKNLGYDANIESGATVTFGFNGTDGESDFVPYNVILSSLVLEPGNDDPATVLDPGNDEPIDDTELIVSKVYGDLEVIYQDGDVELSVKHNVILPTDYNDVTVVWNSDNTSVIDTDGTVHRPYDSSTFVTLTATISLNDYSLEKSFELRVIKSMYDDYSLDNIYVLDEVDEIYFYNDIVEDTYIYLDSEGKLIRVIGSVSDLIIDSPDEALMAIYGLGKLMGCESVYDELVIDHITNDDYGYTYVFSQVYNSVPVLGSSITLSTDLNGNANGFISYYVPINIGTSSPLSSDSAVGSIPDCCEVLETEKSIDICGESQRFIWSVSYLDSNGLYFIALVDANSGELISNYSPVYYAREQAEDENGNVKDIPVYYDMNNTIAFGDERNKVYLYLDDDLGKDERPVEKTSDGWPAQAVSAYINVMSCKLYYNSNYSMPSLNRYVNTPIYVCIDYWMGENSSFDRECRIGNQNVNALKFGGPTDTHKSWGSYLWIVAHEYTHGIVNALTGLAFSDELEACAINEGYADVMAIIISHKSDWRFTNPSGELMRDMTNPTNVSAEDHLNVLDYMDKDNMPSEAHKCGLFLSGACYYMYEKGFSLEQLSSLVMKTLYLGYGTRASFIDVRLNFEQAAKDMGLSDYQRKVIGEAFDMMNIKLDDEHQLAEQKTVTIIGSVVKAEPKYSSIKYELLDGAEVKVNRKGNQVDFVSCFTEDGQFTISGLQYGKYIITVSKDGFYTTTRTFELRNSSCLTLDSICLIEDSYSGTGTASGVVVDAADKNGVGGLTLRLRKGLGFVTSGTNTNEIVAETITEADGRYVFKNIACGQYTLEVVDEREGVASKDRYVMVSRNTIVFGDDINTHYDITVSNKLDSGSVRIVLEWNEDPHDLDSHLLYDLEERLEINYYYRTYEKDGKTCLNLDVDERLGYGPETITIYEDVSDTYVYYVYRYFGRGTISTSGAKVSVYFGQAMYPKYIFYAPTDGTGDCWTVFSYDSSNAETVSSINVLSAYCTTFDS